MFGFPIANLETKKEHCVPFPFHIENVIPKKEKRARHVHAPGAVSCGAVPMYGRRYVNWPGYLNVNNVFLAINQAIVLANIVLRSLPQLITASTLASESADSYCRPRRGLPRSTRQVRANTASDRCSHFKTLPLGNTTVVFLMNVHSEHCSDKVQNNQLVSSKQLLLVNSIITCYITFKAHTSST